MFNIIFDIWENKPYKISQWKGYFTHVINLHWSKSNTFIFDNKIQISVTYAVKIFFNLSSFQMSLSDELVWFWKRFYQALSSIVATPVTSRVLDKIKLGAAILKNLITSRSESQHSHLRLQWLSPPHVSQIFGK